ncbi:hypothetical protein K435DRAFT_852844 [Dendrothele bispora CBS 962.96]|uniref:Uncharacterized protein n=1 Tax=Dendrothele bispora (strain CBS 962.96) TaxID=1314807 RepID=A0A4S8MI31_DENBC|nr:hypothetical protein K435DRAFT_852844 [Dendrothele bispora CBS 962.96]
MSRRQKLTRRQLLEHLKILDTLPTPLPPTLPPSPPASPTSSLGKRKPDVYDDSDRPKRPRNDHPLPLPPPPPSEPVEDGEVSEEPPVPPSLPPPSALPLRRPKHGMYPANHYETLHNKYHQEGRELKFSGDARFWSTFPRTSKDYRPLADPPPPDSPYHKNGIQIAKLELIDALVRFTFAIWNKDYSRGTCNFELWDSSDAYIEWCRNKWVGDDSTNEAEKAFRGLIDMIHAFILIRKAVFHNRLSLKPQAERMFNTAKTRVATAIESSDPANKSHTPPMLPSPANSIGATRSANSTPTGSDSTPNPSSDSSPSSSNPEDAVVATKPGPAIPRDLLPKKYSTNKQLPIPAHVTAAANTISIPINPQFIHSLYSHSKSFYKAREMVAAAESVLNLPIIARHFPRTFARMVYTSLSPNEEFEPDFEDEEGELFWPTQCASGEGLGWVCLMGQAMIKEYGKPYGYIGHAGIIKKPTGERPRPRPVPGR